MGLDSWTLNSHLFNASADPALKSQRLGTSCSMCRCREQQDPSLKFRTGNR